MSIRSGKDLSEMLYRIDDAKLGRTLKQYMAREDCQQTKLIRAVVSNLLNFYVSPECKL